MKSTKNSKEDESVGDGWVKKIATNLPLLVLLVLQSIYNTILKFHQLRRSHQNIGGRGGLTLSSLSWAKFSVFPYTKDYVKGE